MKDTFTLAAGDLRDSITIWHQVPGSDASGATMTWAEFFTTWAKIEPMRGADVIKQGQDVGQVFVQMKIRHDSRITDMMQVVGPNGTYRIQAVEPLGRNVAMRLTCVATGAIQ